MTVKLSGSQAILLRTLVKDGPQFSTRMSPTTKKLTDEGYAKWVSQNRIDATDKGREFVKGS